MVYIILALAIVTMVAVIVAAAASAGLKAEKIKTADLTAKLAAKDKDMQERSAVANDEVSRREAVITSLKTEIASMEKDLETNKDPAAVRARLGALLRA